MKNSLINHEDHEAREEKRMFAICLPVDASGIDTRHSSLSLVVNFVPFVV